MAISGHVTSFAGREVKDFDQGSGISDPLKVAYALRVDYEDTFSGLLDRLLQDPQATQLEALVIGSWAEEMYDEDSAPVVADLVSARDRLPNLKALFIGDITYEEFGISWIQQSDMAPVLAAYPNLEVLQVRGGNGLHFSSLRHDTLKKLVVQTGGLSPTTIADICAAHLPNLEHLELWLGSEDYGGDATVEDVVPIISGNLFPKLSYLGLADSEIADQIANALLQAPVMKQIKQLDMSMGTLSNKGAEALIDALIGSSVKWLDVSQNYLSEKMIQRLSWLPLELLADDQKEEDDYDEEEDHHYRYVSVAE
ncbi:MAG: STM4015 family protein [Ardenticatenaceae bacterium]